jgi:hypothetical protein
MHRQTDLRLRRDEYLSIPSSQSVKAISEYVERVSFNPSRNRRIVAPPFLELDLDSDGLLGGNNKTVTYFLKEADFRKELNCTFMDQHVSYAEIEGGEAWGRRKQLSMMIAEEPLGHSNKGVSSAIEGLLSKVQE